MVGLNLGMTSGFGHKLGPSIFLYNGSPSFGAGNSVARSICSLQSVCDAVISLANLV